jgi:hypothetical protein
MQQPLESLFRSFVEFIEEDEEKEKKGEVYVSYRRECRVTHLFIYS